MSLHYGLLPDTDKSILEFQAFHNLLFKNTDASFEWFNWYLRRIPLEHQRDLKFQTRIYTLRDDDRLVGTWCVEPKDFRVDGEDVKVGRCFSVGIHPDYRRRNLFVELSKHAIQSERTLKQYDHILGFPQVGRPVIDAHLKSGWERVQVIDALGRAPGRDNPTSLKHVYVIDDFEIRNERAPQAAGAFVETNRYRNVRWLQHPDSHYICLGAGTGYIVLKPYASACHILALDGTEEQVGLLLDATNTLAHRHRWEEITTWCAVNNKFRPIVEKRGYTLNPKFALSVELLAAQIHALDPLELGACHCHMGSEEIY